MFQGLREVGAHRVSPGCPRALALSWDYTGVWDSPRSFWPNLSRENHSKSPTISGKGSVEGLIASESANNSVIHRRRDGCRCLRWGYRRGA